jgi:arylsulfatase A-like enzyme
LIGFGCADQKVDERPSFVLVVVDTLRADAVSAYGAVDGTTPFIDTLAAGGVRYENAFAPSPWTLPSHATLLTGLPPELHGVGVTGHLSLPDGFPTLAGDLTAAGYDTIGLSENPIVSGPFGIGRGFDHFESELEMWELSIRRHQELHLDVVQRIRDWAKRRDRTRPFFLFVNLFGVHDPYEFDPEHDFLPAGANREQARRMNTGGTGRGVAETVGICARLPPADQLSVLKGLYLGGVAKADSMLAAVVAAARALSGRERIIIIVTSDHGEHLGEHGLLGHEFSLHDELLRVPLIVHGATESETGVVVEPVGLGQIAAAIRKWAGLRDSGGLPRVGDESDEPRVLRAVFSDNLWGGPKGLTPDNKAMDRQRMGCTPQDPVFGNMLSAARGRWKLIWYERSGTRLFDRLWDPLELFDVADHHPEIVSELSQQLDVLREELARAEKPPLDRPDDVLPGIEALRALGYIE